MQSHQSSDIQVPEIFPLTSLPAELTLHIASFLPPATVFALLRTSSSFAHLKTTLNKLAKQDVAFPRLGGEPSFYTPLQWFAHRKIPHMVEFLLRIGLSPNSVYPLFDEVYISPLLYAIKNKDPNTFSLLLSHGAHPDACDNGECTRCNTLQGHKSTLNHRGSTPLHMACDGPIDEDMLHIVQLLAGRVEPDERNPDGYTPLHLLCKVEDMADHTSQNAEAVLKALLSAGARINRTCEELVTLNSMFGAVQPIHLAAEAGNVVMLRALLRAGADVHARMENGATALHLAVHSGCREVVDVLIAAGADVSARTWSGLRPAALAKSHGWVWDASQVKYTREWLAWLGTRSIGGVDELISEFESTMSWKRMRRMLTRNGEKISHLS